MHDNVTTEAVTVAVDFDDMYVIEIYAKHAMTVSVCERCSPLTHLVEQTSVEWRGGRDVRGSDLSFIKLRFFFLRLAGALRSCDTCLQLSCVFIGHHICKRLYRA